MKKAKLFAVISLNNVSSIGLKKMSLKWSIQLRKWIHTTTRREYPSEACRFRSVEIQLAIFSIKLNKITLEH